MLNDRTKVAPSSVHFSVYGPTLHKPYRCGKCLGADNVFSGICGNLYAIPMFCKYAGTSCMSEQGKKVFSFSILGHASELIINGDN
jgi:hypothetical protein